MAGSSKWFNYQSDDGTDWAIFADESNTEAANAGVLAPAGLFKPPANLRPRFAVFGNEAGTRNIRVTITTQAIYNALSATDSIPDTIAGTGNLAFIRKRPELIGPTPTIFDTGLDDGDQP
jgi:hypothetical protein